MKRKILLGIFITILLALFVYAIDLYYTQEQLDALNVSAMTWQTLLCTSDSKIYLEQSNLITYYNCSDMEVLDGDAPYHFYTGEFYTSVLLNEIQLCLSILDICNHEVYSYVCEYNESCDICIECEDCTTNEWCEAYYWDKVVDQAINNIDSIIHNIEIHQTGYNDGEWGNWTGDLFG